MAKSVDNIQWRRVINLTGQPAPSKAAEAKSVSDLGICPLKYVLFTVSHSVASRLTRYRALDGEILGRNIEAVLLTFSAASERQPPYSKQSRLWRRRIACPSQHTLAGEAIPSSAAQPEMTAKRPFRPGCAICVARYAKLSSGGIIRRGRAARRYDVRRLKAKKMFWRNWLTAGHGGWLASEKRPGPAGPLESPKLPISAASIRSLGWPGKSASGQNVGRNISPRLTLFVAQWLSLSGLGNWRRSPGRKASTVPSTVVYWLTLSAIVREYVRKPAEKSR